MELGKVLRHGFSFATWVLMVFEDVVMVGLGCHFSEGIEAQRRRYQPRTRQVEVYQPAKTSLLGESRRVDDC